MLSFGQLCHVWRKRLKTTLPQSKYACYRVTNLLWLIVGVFLARHIHLTVIARKLPIRVQKLSLERRFRRFLDNPGVNEREWYHPLMKQLLEAASRSGCIHLIIDGTKIGSHHRLVMVAVAFRRRALPIAWAWGNTTRGHMPQRKQIRLLAYVNQQIPRWSRVSLVGDSEFGGTKLITKLQRWGWWYALRQRGRTTFKPADLLSFYRFDQAGVTPGYQLWQPLASITRQFVTTNICIVWHPHHARPWYLATNLLTLRETVRHYRRRMWIEEMFRDFKRQGFDLEVSRLGTAKRLSRLTLVVCLLYVWLVAVGQQVVKRKLQALIDRANRQDLSYFRLGWDFIERCLVLGDPVPRWFSPSFKGVR